MSCCLFRLIPKSIGSYSCQETGWMTVACGAHSCCISHKLFPNSEVTIVRRETLSSTLHLSCDCGFRVLGLILPVLRVIEEQYWFVLSFVFRSCPVLVPDFEVRFPFMATLVLLNHFSVLFWPYACFRYSQQKSRYENQLTRTFHGCLQRLLSVNRWNCWKYRSGNLQSVTHSSGVKT